MKIITICGSLKFKDKLVEEALRLELEGNVVLVPIFPDNRGKDDFSDEELKILGEMHYKRIEMSDAIYVINVDNYIGSSTSKEIEYAKSLNKEIMYLINEKKN